MVATPEKEGKKVHRQVTPTTVLWYLFERGMGGKGKRSICQGGTPARRLQPLFFFFFFFFDLPLSFQMYSRSTPKILLSPPVLTITREARTTVQYLH